MPSELPKITAKEAIVVVEKLGFVLARQSGSHMIYKNALGKRITIPYHAGKILHPKIVKSIIKDSEINTDEFKKML